MNRKYRFHPGMYELGENEKFYSDMEARGWRLTKRGAYLSRFERVEPSAARYRVEVYTPPFLEQSVLPEEQIAVFADCGWEYVADHGNLHIFRAPEGSDAPEFYDDPAQQAATLRKVRWDIYWSLGLAALIVVLAVRFLGFGDRRFWAETVKRAIQCPTVFTFYFSWLAWVLVQGLVEGWKVNRTYRRLKKGLPLDHEPKGKPALRRALNQGLLGLALASLLLTGVQLLTTRSYDLPEEPDGPYIMLRDAGYDGMPGKLFYREPGVTRTTSFLTDYWETLEVINVPAQNNKQIWIHQEVYRLRFPGMADRLAWALREDSVFARDADSFDPIEAPGLDHAWTTGSLELVAVKGDIVIYVEYMTDTYDSFDPQRICAALAERWAEG